VRVVIRSFFRHVLLLLTEEWGKAQTDMYASQNVHAVKAATDAEIAELRIAVQAVGKLQREAAIALAKCPWAKDLITDMLWERAEHLRASVHEAGSNKHAA
jgi:hypothetical protein